MDHCGSESWRIATFILGATLAIGLSSVVANADEGMWLVNKPPLQHLKSVHGFEPTPEWMEHAQKSAVRFNVGGSGSIVSADGLVMTNHHVASDTLAKLSTKERNLLDTGFVARTRAEELKCPDLELLVLWTITDVSDRVAAAVPAGASVADAGVARRRAIAGIEKTAGEQSGMHCEVVTLYNGGRYHLYEYRRYTDVRLVFAPEQAAAFFGGDTDNFEYPRFNLDCAFFRIYDNDKPLRPEHHLSWSDGAKEGDLALVFGHPGSTRRGYTLDHVRWLRDKSTPQRLARVWRTEAKLAAFAPRSAEHRRVSSEDRDGVANGRKATTGIMSGLADPAIVASKKRDEDALRTLITQRMCPDEAKATLGAFDAIAHSRGAADELAPMQRVLRSWGGEYGAMGTHIVRLAAELPRASAERLREYGDARLPSLYQALYSPAPIYDFFETFKIEQGLLDAVETLGGDHPFTLALLGGKSPRQRAEELVGGASFKSPEARKKLVEGGAAALAEAMKNDPMLRLIADIDAQARAVRTRSENEVESVERDAYAKIAAARFAAQGESVYPDATFSLRMSFGPIKGYVEDGRSVPAFTTLAGMFQRFDERKGQEGFDLPESWLKAKDRLRLDTPFNFVCSADIIGGSSGSPVINTQGKVIGLIFDGNIHSLVADIQYANDGLGRAVAVDSRAMLEALSVVYGADGLVRELAGR